MNGGCNAFGSGNRANATIGRALRLVLLNVGGGWPGELDKSTLGHPGKYTYCVAENEAASPWAPYHVEKGFSSEDSAVFVLAAEPPHSVTNHVANDPEGILDSIASAMTTIANNNAVSSGHCAVVIGPEHARTIAAKGWTRHDVRNYLAMHAYNLFSEISFSGRYGKIYNRNLPKWYKREPDARIPIVPSPTISISSSSAARRDDFPHSSPAGVTCPRPSCAASKPPRSRKHRSALTARAIFEELDGHRKNLCPPGVGEVSHGDALMRNAPDQLVFDPRGVVETERLARSARVRKLEGLRLAVLDNTKWNANRLLRKTVARLEQNYAFAAVNYYRKESFSKEADPALIRTIAADNDIVLTAIGD